YDRLVHGAVVDFLHFHYAGWSWPAFNLADSAITVGVVLMLWGQFRHDRRPTPEKPS
ncbi:signal peptidase II, partial [Thauera propionica]